MSYCGPSVRRRCVSARDSGPRYKAAVSWSVVPGGRCIWRIPSNDEVGSIDEVFAGPSLLSEVHRVQAPQDWHPCDDSDDSRAARA